MDARQDSALRDGHTGKQLVQLLIVAHSQLKMAGVDAGLLVVTSCIPCQLQNFGGEVLEHCSQVDGSSSSDAISVVPHAKFAVDTANRELEPGS